jgi:hypothetical protein
MQLYTQQYRIMKTQQLRPRVMHSTIHMWGLFTTEAYDKEQVGAITLSRFCQSLLALPLLPITLASVCLAFATKHSHFIQSRSLQPIITCLAFATNHARPLLSIVTCLVFAFQTHTL